MKKLSLTVLSVVMLLCTTFSGKSTQAQNVGLDQAKQVGSYFLSVMNNTQMAKPADVRLVYQVTNLDLNIPAAYIFNIPDQGYVVVSGSECGNPIIGFSDEDTLDANNMAPAMKWWVDGYARQIIDAQNAKAEPAADKLNDWSILYNHELPSMANEPKATYLIDTKWDQGEATSYNPTYNKFCPQVNGRYCYTGCVATAMAMIIHYWQYPKNGKSTNSYTWKGQTISVNYQQDGHYDYDNMPVSISSSSPTEQIDAVALLMYHAGVSVNMSYDIDGSGTQSVLVGPAMKNNFKYRTSYQLRRNSYSDQKWIDTCTFEISNRRPMYYSGYNSAGGEGRDAAGHAFICDGVKSGQPKYFHFNWGWGGGSNGYFNLYTSTLTAGGYNFNEGQALYVRMDPPVDSNIYAGIHTVTASLAEPAYPSPASYQVTIPYELMGQSSADLQIYNVEGKLVRSITVYANEYSVDVNVTDLPKGMYLYRLNGQSNKFLVQ